MQVYDTMVRMAHDNPLETRGIVNHGMYERYHHDVVGVNSRLDKF